MKVLDRSTILKHKMVDQHPTVEEKIIEELKLVIPEGETEKSQLFEEKELSKLVYLHAALCESLRLYPPVPIQHKEPTQVDTHCPRGTVCTRK
ncbi:unnamed protein product [Camellia sinensis]